MNLTHQKFLGTYAEPDEHFSFDANPYAYFVSGAETSKEQLNKALDNEDINVRYRAMEQPNIDIEHIDKAINDPHPYIRELAIRHPLSTREHVERGLADEHTVVHKSAQLVKFRRGWEPKKPLRTGYNLD